MELRSSRKTKEYQKLQDRLVGMDAYEEGMGLREMRQVLHVLEKSLDDETEKEVQQALRASELDFMPSQRSQMLNSTMVRSQSGSPEPQSQTIVVQAVVHHPMDWSPTSEHLLRKRLASSSDSDDNISGSGEHENTSGTMEPNAKRFHEIRGPVAMRRVIDSGVNMSNEDEMPSTSRNTSNETSNNLFSIEDGNTRNVANSLQFSTSSAAISGEHESKEHSESSV